MLGRGLFWAGKKIIVKKNAVQKINVSAFFVAFFGGFF